MNFISIHCAKTVPPPDVHKAKIAGLLDGLAIPNEKVYGEQGSAACAPGINLYAYAHKYDFLPSSWADKQLAFTQQEMSWRGLGIPQGPVEPDSAVEPLHFRIDNHLVVAEIGPTMASKKTGYKQAAESISEILKQPICQTNQPFTNPRGYGWTMQGLMNWALFTGDPAAIAGWFTLLDKLVHQIGTELSGEPYVTQHPSKADHGNKLVCVWMTGRLALAVAQGMNFIGGYGKNAMLDAVANKALECLVWAEKVGHEATGLQGRLVDDYDPGIYLTPGKEHSYGVMSRWCYPAALELAQAGVPGAQAFLDGPIKVAFLADDQMRPVNWKVGNGWGAMHVASIATFMAPHFGWMD